MPTVRFPVVGAIVLGLLLLWAAPMALAPTEVTPTGAPAHQPIPGPSNVGLAPAIPVPPRPPSHVPRLKGPIVTGSVIADVNDYGTAPLLVGLNVSAYPATCPPSSALPSGCGPVNWTATNASGGFAVEIPNGSYVFDALPDPGVVGPAYPFGFGGSSKDLTVMGPVTVRLPVYPEIPYDNRSIVLPGYACDSAYLNDVGGKGPGCQNPVLSWTQGGAYYLTATNELVFYSFANGTLEDIAPWVPLYQKFADYAMIPNQLFITQDGTYIYGWGSVLSTTSPTTPTPVSAEAVNISTHRVFEYTFSGVNTSSVTTNGQVQLTGWDGNDSQLTLVLANGDVIDHPLWSNTQSSVATLNYFEANNLYWEPYLNGYVNVEAEGSSSDGVEEWQLTGPTSDLLTRTYSESWGSGIEVNGVNGIAFNTSSRQLSLQDEWSGLTYQVDSNGTLSSLLQVTNRYPAGTTPAYPLAPIFASDRPELVSNGPMINGNYPGFDNDSFLVSMTPGHLGWYSTNTSPLTPNKNVSGLPNFSWLQWAQEGFFVNSSYLIAPNSYLCDTAFRGACSVNGTGGAARGTIWWMWRTGLPEFPNTGSTMVADAEPPPAPVLTVGAISRSSISLSWAPLADSGLINYTLAWGRAPDLTNFISLLPSNRSFSIEGLSPGTTYDLSLQAWNLHFHGPWSAASAKTAGVPDDFPVTFGESGLPRSDTWYLNLTGISPESAAGSTTEISLNLTNGTYDYTVATNDPRFEAEPAGGNVTVAGGPVTAPPIVFVPVNRTITFQESGLLNRTLWWVAVGSTTLRSHASAIEFEEPYGTYNFTLGTGRGGNVSGTFTVVTRNVSVPAAFFKLTFRERGLSSGSLWNATVNGVTQRSNTSRIAFYLENGTWVATFGAGAGETTPPAQFVTIAGAPIGTNVTFHREPSPAISSGAVGSPTSTGAGIDWTARVRTPG